MTEPTDVPPYRMGVLYFAATSVATLTGFVVAALTAVPVRALPSGLEWLGLFTLLLPPAGAAVGFAFVSRDDSGRRGLAIGATFLGSAASTILLLPSGPLMLLLVPLAAGGFALLSRRLLTPAGTA
ncbi:MAG: hypothetical protein WAN48_13440 [Actinomycetes bacterium]